ncbi:shikimate dehydrogenase family protein [Pseudooceanicola nanhaiensis]|uniref:shikimate dehydrogenase family protein n=1 Tax=Pseudooceanicola nanhaiensis TaxID=375761 RepID=UPI001CD561CD|nr:hypothetical protein [Pseudooceanicola nanhaiensis]MCA0919951.1 hypothetical protein [Pseudooceanicola nanhaiensis]
MQITGKTKYIPIIGHPAWKVVSPPAINARLAEERVDAVMTALDVTPEALPAFWTLLRSSETMLGCSITFPHKQPAFDEVDSRTDRADRLGALNTLRRGADGSLTGDATDGLALCAAIAAAGHDLAGRSARIVGAGGGAGLAIVDAFCEAGVTALVLAEADPARLDAVMDLLVTHWPRVALLAPDSPVDVQVNATTLGLKETDTLPFTDAELQSAAFVCDIVGPAGQTVMTRRAAALGTPVVDGAAMGEGQVAAQLSFILDRPLAG